MKSFQNKNSTFQLMIIAAIVFGFAQIATAQQLKPTEILYSRLPSDLSQPPVGANSPTVWAVGQDGSNEIISRLNTIHKSAICNQHNSKNL